MAAMQGGAGSLLVASAALLFTGECLLRRGSGALLCA